MPEEKQPTPARISAVIDRIESGLAVVVLTDDDEIQFDLPLKYLPAGVKEGDRLTFAVEPDAADAEAARERIAEIKKELKRSDPDQMDFKL
jgi:hypothetical protein